MINNLPGIISIETFHVSELHSIGILKFDSKESAEKSKVVYIDNMKKIQTLELKFLKVKDHLL